MLLGHIVVKATLHIIKSYACCVPAEGRRLAPLAKITVLAYGALLWEDTLLEHNACAAMCKATACDHIAGMLHRCRVLLDGRM